MGRMGQSWPWEREEGAVAKQFQTQRAFEAGFGRKSPLL